jgi:DNA-binding NtrC family response regulator
MTALHIHQFADVQITVLRNVGLSVRGCPSISPVTSASRRTMPASDRTLDASEIVVRIDQPFGAAIQHLERTMVHAALAKTRSVDEAAKLLGVSRKGLYLKRLRYGMEIDRPKNGSEVA